jgi:hypothetical protein
VEACAVTDEPARIFVLRLRAPRDGAIRKLRWILKRLLRAYDLKCLSVEEEKVSGEN